MHLNDKVNFLTDLDDKVSPMDDLCGIVDLLPEDTLSEGDKLRDLGAPAWLWIDLSDAACCMDGFCSECASEI